MSKAGLRESISNIEPRVFSSWTARYSFAVVIVAIATGLRFGLEALNPFHSAFLLFYPAVVVVAMWAGFWPGILATTLAAISGAYFFEFPRQNFSISSSRTLIDPLLFAVVGYCLTLLTCSRNQALGSLRSREDRLRALFKHQFFGIAITSSDKRWVEVNDTWCEMIGYSRQELAEKDWAALTHPDDLLANMALFKRLSSGEIDRTQYEKRFIRKDGSVLYAYVSLSCVRRKDGTAEYFLGLLTDITERKQVEAQLRESEDRYRDLVEHSEDLACTHDLEGRLLSVNAAPARILGYEVEELLKIPMRELIIPEGRVLFDEYLERLRTTGQPEQGLLCVMTRSGQVRTWEFRNTLRTEGVATPVVRGMAHDVTERRKAELALGVSEERYRKLFEKTVAGIGIVSLDGEMIDCNDAWAHMFGYANAAACRGTMVGRHYFDAADREKLLQEIARSGSLTGRELHLQRVDGTGFWLLANDVLLLGNGSQQLLQATVIDITARKQAEEALRTNEERFRVALKDSPITVFNQDRDLVYTWIYNSLLGRPDNMLGKNDVEVFGDEIGSRFHTIKQRVMDTGIGKREEMTFTFEGQKRSLEVTIEPLHDADGQIVGITAAAVDIARLRGLLDRAQIAREKLFQEKLYLEHEIRTELGFEEIIGQSNLLRGVLSQARVVAPTGSTVLLLGETGTGKELVARSIHSLSLRKDRNFIKLNCAAVPSGLLESELFGHEKGAFTGAVAQKAGRVELADKGTLFLDEIGELPPELQPKLLRVLQDREFERLGGVRTLKVDVRIISATNRDLQKDVTEKKFREDLFYRLNVFPIQLPPLRERRSDIPMLVRHFVAKHALRMGKQIEVIPEATVDLLQKWNWPGNIRELENVVERMVILTTGAILAEPPVEPDAEAELQQDNLSEMEREYIVRVLRETNGVLSGAEGAASRLGIKRTTLQSMVKRLGIEPHEYKRGMTQ